MKYSLIVFVQVLLKKFVPFFLSVRAKADFISLTFILFIIMIISCLVFCVSVCCILIGLLSSHFVPQYFKIIIIKLLFLILSHSLYLWLSPPEEFDNSERHTHNFNSACLHPYRKTWEFKKRESRECLMKSK